MCIRNPVISTIIMTNLLRMGLSHNKLIVSGKYHEVESIGITTMLPNTGHCREPDVSPVTAGFLGALLIRKRGTAIVHIAGTFGRRP